MTDKVQNGHEHHTDHAAVIPLNSALEAELDEQQRSAIVATIARLCENHADEATIRTELREVLDRVGISQPEPVVNAIAENVARAGGDTLVADSRGEVLHGDPAWDPATATPDVRGSEDPESGDRPAYS